MIDPIHIHPDHPNGRPNYRFFKLIYTAALRLKLALPLDKSIEFFLQGEKSNHTAHKKDRATYEGTLTIDEKVFHNVVYVIDSSNNQNELVTFWLKSQKGDAEGSKGGAHPFAEAYLGYLAGKSLLDQTFSPQLVADEVADKYNTDPRFNITAWIIQKAQALKEEPSTYEKPVEEPTTAPLPSEFIPELLLRNKWKTDVLRSGISYTNYEVDACIKNVHWSTDDRIACDLHWEDGKFLLIEDFGRFDRFTNIAGRTKVFDYLKKYANTESRCRLILTVKGDSSQWTLASSTMLKRLKTEIAR